MSEFLERLKRDPDAVWHQLRRRVCSGSPALVAFGQVLHDPRAEQARLLVSIAAPARNIVIPRRWFEAEKVEEVRIMWDSGAMTVPVEEIEVRSWTETHVLLRVPQPGA